MPRPFLEQCQNVIERLPAIAPKIFHIRTEEEGIRLIEPNRPQLTYHTDRVARGYASRDVILKARKHGFTTWKALEGLLCALSIDGWAGGIFVHETEAAERVFKIVRWAYDRLPEDMRYDHKLNQDRKDAIEIGGSTLYVYTAGAKGAGRSETFHWLHCSEVAFWKDPQTTFAGATEAVPRNGHICKESTPNGRENFWYDLCTAAAEGTSPDKLYFFPWWWGDENYLELQPGEVIMPSDEELGVMAVARRDGFELSSEHLKWRRWKLSGPELGESFYQEHPEDPETCFLVSGNPVFDPHLLRRLEQRAQGEFIMEKEWAPGNGERIVWRRPGGTSPYVISVDVATGMAHGDWSVINVWQILPENMFNVARTKLKCSTDELAVRTEKEARLYHDALVCIERNNVGSEVVRKMDEMGYFNQYRALDIDGEETDRLGWHTNVRTQRVMVEEFVSATNAGYIISFDTELWGQAMNLTRDEFGRPQFPKKKHDDILVTGMFAVMAKEQARRSAGGAMMASYA